MFFEKLRINSGVLRVARGGSGAKAPPLAACPSTVQETGLIWDCSFYLPVSMLLFTLVAKSGVSTNVQNLSCWHPSGRPSIQCDYWQSVNREFCVKTWCFDERRLCVPDTWIAILDFLTKQSSENLVFRCKLNSAESPRFFEKSQPHLNI